MTTVFIRAVEQALQPLADTTRAPGMAAYMKHHFTYLGIPTPARRAACKPLIRAFDGDTLVAAQALWRKTEREYQYLACDLLRHHAKHLDGNALPQLEALKHL